MSESKQSKEHLQEDTDPTLLMAGAKDFFAEQFKLDFTENHQLAIEPTLEHLDQLAAWHQETRRNGDMPTIDTFYKKVFLAQALMPQRDEKGEIQYVFGKGVAVEIALQGRVEDRKNTSVKVPFRPHDDFEIYGAQDTSSYNNLLGGTRFKHVFGAQELYPRTFTKGLKNLQDDELIKTAESVDLGGVEILIPNLELMFVDKFEKSGSFETEARGMTDAQLLANTYELDRKLIHRAVEDYVIKPAKDEMQDPMTEVKTAKEAIVKVLSHARKHVLAKNPQAAENSLVLGAKLQATPFRWQLEASYGLSMEEILDGNYADVSSAGKDRLLKFFQVKYARTLADIDARHSEVDEMLH